MSPPPSAVPRRVQHWLATVVAARVGQPPAIAEVAEAAEEVDYDEVPTGVDPPLLAVVGCEAPQAEARHLKVVPYQQLRYEALN